MWTFPSCSPEVAVDGFGCVVYSATFHVKTSVPSDPGVVTMAEKQSESVQKKLSLSLDEIIALNNKQQKQQRQANQRQEPQGPVRRQTRRPFQPVASPYKRPINAAFGNRPGEECACVWSPNKMQDASEVFPCRNVHRAVCGLQGSSRGECMRLCSGVLRQGCRPSRW